MQLDQDKFRWSDDGGKQGMKVKQTPIGMSKWEEGRRNFAMAKTARDIARDGIPLDLLQVRRAPPDDKARNQRGDRDSNRESPLIGPCMYDVCSD